VLGGFAAAADLGPSANVGLVRGAFAEGVGPEPVESGWAGAVRAAFKASEDEDDAGALIGGEAGDAAEIVPGESFPDDNVFAGDAFATVGLRAGADGAGAVTRAGDCGEKAVGCGAAAGSR